VTMGELCDRASGSISQVAHWKPPKRNTEYHIQQAVVEAHGFDLLSMGRPEGPGCYCYVNNLVRRCGEISAQLAPDSHG